MSDLDISDNLCYNFMQSAVLGWVIDIERLNSHTYTRLFIQNNKVDAGDDANRAIYVVAGTIAGGIVSNNYVRGGLVGSATGITQRDNDVTGSTSWT